MNLLILANQATAARRRVYFHLVSSDGITAVTTEAGGQPQISTSGGAFTNTGIGTLSAIGNGRYYADLTQAAVASAGDSIETRYKSASTAECPGDSVRVVAFDPDDAAALGLTRIDAAVSSVAAAVWAVGTRTLTAFSFAVDISAAAVTLIWDKATSALTTAGSIGKLLVDNVTASIAAVKAKTDSLTFTSAGKVDATIQAAGDFAQAAADKVWASATRTLTSLGTLVADIVTALSGTTVTVVSPVTDDGGTLTLVRGDDYFVADGTPRTISFSSASWPNLTSASAITMTARTRANTDPVWFAAADKTSSRVVGSGTQTVYFELTAANTAAVVKGTKAGKFDVQAVLASGHIVTLVEGVIDGVEDQTRA